MVPGIPLLIIGGGAGGAVGGQPVPRNLERPAEGRMAGSTAGPTKSWADPTAAAIPARFIRDSFDAGQGQN